MGSFPNPALRIGEWRVDPALDEIQRGAQVVKLEPRTMQLLLYLAERAQQVVSPEELLEHVWRGVVVSPSSVYQAVARLRRTLGDVSDAPTYIATVPRKGYRLIATVGSLPPAGAHDPAAARAPPGPVAPQPPAEPDAPVRKAASGSSAGRSTGRYRTLRPAGWAVAAALLVAAGLAFWLDSPESLRRIWEGHAVPRSIAVLPFLSLGGSSDDQYLGYGLSEDLINSLANVAGLQVAARTSSFVFAGNGGDLRQIRDRLNVDAVLEGSVRRHGGRLRVVAELIDARSGYHLWSQAFERDDQELWAVHEEIADAVLEHMDPALTRPTRGADSRRAQANGAAYNEFLRGRYLLEERTELGLNQAVDHFQRAIALAPDDALAYSGLANAYALLAQYASHDDPTALAQARGAALHALSLSPDLAEANAALGLTELQAGRLEEAVPHLRRAISLDPHYGPAQMWYGRTLFLQQDFIGADRVFEKALTFDPLSPMLQLNAGLALDELDHLPEATAHARRAIELEPKLPSAYWLLAFLRARDGQLSEAAQLFDTATTLGLNQAEGLGQMASVYAELGDCDSAARALRLGAQRDPLDWAVLQAGIAYHLCRHDLKGLIAPMQELRQQHAADAHVLASAALGLAMAGEARQALDAYRAAEAAVEGEAALLSRAGFGIGVSHALEYAALARAAGLRDKARALTGQVQERLDAIREQGGRAAGLDYCAAASLAQQGQVEGALAALQNAVQAGWRAADWTEQDPALAPLHGAPQFTRLIAQQRRELAAQRAQLAGDPAVSHQARGG